LIKDVTLQHCQAFTSLHLNHMSSFENATSDWSEANKTLFTHLGHESYGRHVFSFLHYISSILDSKRCKFPLPTLSFNQLLLDVLRI